MLCLCLRTRFQPLLAFLLLRYLLFGGSALIPCSKTGTSFVCHFLTSPRNPGIFSPFLPAFCPAPFCLVSPCCSSVVCQTNPAPQQTLQPSSQPFCSPTEGRGTAQHGLQEGSHTALLCSSPWLPAPLPPQALGSALSSITAPQQPAPGPLRLLM